MSQAIWPWSTKWSRAKANRVFPRESTGPSKHCFPTTQDMTLHMDITRWSTPKSDWLYSLQLKMEKLYTVSENKTGSWLWLDHELLIAKFSLKLKKAGKTIRPFRYDLNQITYYYTVEVTNKFKGLDMINSAWRTVGRGLYIVQEAVTKTIPKKKKWKKAKWLSEEALHSWEKKRSEKQRRKGKIYSSECLLPRNKKER